MLLRQALIRAYKKKAFLCLPHKHSALASAHGRYREVTAAFVVLLRHRLAATELGLAAVLPGQLLEDTYEVVVGLGPGTAHLWRQVVHSTYSRVITEPR